MLRSSELAGLVQGRLISILKVSKSPDINNMLLELIRDMQKHTSVAPGTYRCHRCGHEIRAMKYYCSYCIGKK